MCGIAGIVSGFLTEKSISDVRLMLDTQKHRGPDSQKYFRLDDHVIFGHNRLSIIDLSESANQPFFSKDQRFCIVFNGEIYNYLELRDQLSSSYSFSTDSDTEVLLAAYITWGVEALDRLIGMFAFAIYDKENQEIFMARDRFGVKPFYYSFGEGNSFCFASEIKTLHAAGIPKIKNEELWAAYLSHGTYQYENQTFWKNIFQLEAGHFIKCQVANLGPDIKRQEWYHFVENIHALRTDTSYLKRSQEEHLIQYKALLEEAVRLRFRSDVPVGFNISGGLDSSLLLSSVDSLWKDIPIEAFTFYCNDNRYDELPWVEELIAQTNKPLNKVLLTALEVEDLKKQVAYFQDEPFGGIPTLAYSKIFKAAREKGVVVLLDGNGMDEAWAGYDYYHNVYGGTVQGVTKSAFKKEVLNKDFADSALTESYLKPFDEELLNKQYRDLFFTKIPRVLRFNDRISMMYSTELREPFLDHRLVEYAFALPLAMKIQDGQVKWALRQLAKEYLNSEMILAPKRPLQTPQREWLTEDLLPWVEDDINKLVVHPWFDSDRLIKVWGDFKISDKQNTFFLWQWLSVIAN
jgi:asparagine synthase (glutamine-hydrolysing)